MTEKSTVPFASQSVLYFCSVKRYTWLFFFLCVGGWMSSGEGGGEERDRTDQLHFVSADI